MSRQPFQTVRCLDREPNWRPLELLSRECRLDLTRPSFHPGEFMYMGCVESKRKRLTIHLYKHRDTRRYLNLDEAGNAYQYRGGSLRDRGDVISGGRYRLWRSIDDALEHADLWLFDETALIRSFPPSMWPADPTHAG